MRYRYSCLVVLLLTFALAACGGQTAGGVSGTWTGEVSGPGGTVPLSLELAQTGAAVSGTITLAGETGSVTGTAANNLISLADSSGVLAIEGSVSGDSMQGTIAVTDAEGTFSAAFTASR